MTSTRKYLAIFVCTVLMLIGMSTVMPSAAQAVCIDADLDGYGTPASPDCAYTQLDCDDTDANVHPGAARICDGKDSNCDGRADFSTDVDNDNDGWPLCIMPGQTKGDCNDNNPNMFPANTEAPLGMPICSDGFDNDCDGKVDGADTGCMSACLDQDNDGYGNPGSVFCPNGEAVDCDDADLNVNPGMTDTNCNGIDDNCSGTADDGYVETVTNCGAGACLRLGLNQCQAGVVINTCTPGAPQQEGPLDDPTCSDTVDNDCDNFTDLDDPGCLTPCIDNDGDGYGSNGDASCANGTAIDCDDTNPNINPSMTDTDCNGVDENCSGAADEGYAPTPTNCGVGACERTGQMECQAGAVVDTCTAGTPATEGPNGSPTCSDAIDNDCDGIVDLNDVSCNDPAVDDDHDGYSENTGDCDDNDNTVYPGAPKICDGKDNNCDGRADTATDVDNDGDGWPLCIMTGQSKGDCNDNNAIIFPGNTEAPKGYPICLDGLDNDCDGKIDILDPGCQVFCADNDLDGYGNPGSPFCPNGAAVDCNDADPNVNSSMTDTNCNGIDENCSGAADEGYVATASNCGVGSCGRTGQNECQAGVIVDTCTPGLPQLEGPLNDPTCSDLADNDCDNLIDDLDPGCLTPCIDNDGDGYGTNGDASCANGTAIDCNDANSNINPGMTDTDCNGVDENCSGAADEGYAITPTTCGLGACYATGQMECQSGAVVDTCTPGASVPETTLNFNCSDAIDNDCDGLIDIAQDPSCNDPNIDDDSDGFTENGGDCDDFDPRVYPGAAKICDGKDNNCDGRRDFITDYDQDQDGWPLCIMSGQTVNDCNDLDPAVNPGNIEGPVGDATCSDVKDNDCDGKVDALDTDCQAPLCGTKTNPKNGPHMFDLLNSGDNSTIKASCDWCHFDNSGTVDQRAQCQRCHADSADTSDPLNGALKQLYPLNAPYGFGNAPNVKAHASSVLGTTHGTWNPTCLTCHNPHLQEQDLKNGTTYGKLIKELICFDNTANGGGNFEETVTFTSNIGPGSFADGPPHNQNICEMCHTMTNHHQADGTAPGGQSHNDGADCMTCHSHGEGFKPVGGTPAAPHNTAEFSNNCDYCHVSATDFSTPIPDTKCEQCHTPTGILKAADPANFGTAQDVLAHSDINGSGKYTYANRCVDCHNPMFPDTNIKLIRSSLIGSVTPGSNIVFTAASGNGSFADGAPFNENVCETCHVQTVYHRNDGSTPLHNDGAKCTDCHLHSGGFQPGCGACHGIPPTVNTATGAPDGLVNNPGVTGSTTAGAHDRHVNIKGFECANCHNNSPGSSTTHNDGSPQDITIGFSLFGGSYLGGSYDGQATVNYDSSEVNTTVSNGGSKSCSNIYCHGTLPDGSGWGGGQNTSPAWDGTVDCSSCHDRGGSSSGLNYKHSNHTDETRQGFVCEKCHFDTVSGSSSIKNESKHVNNIKDVIFSAGGTFDSGSKSCSNTYCHSDAAGGAPNVQVAWPDSTTVQCDSCHNGRAGLETLEMASNGHARLTSSQWVRQFPCNYCHDNTVDAASQIKDFSLHVNENTDIAISSNWRITGQPDPAYDMASKVCSNIYCHSDGTTVNPQVRPFAWTDGRTKCNTCHGHEQGTCSACHTDGRTNWAPGDEWKAAMPMYINTGPGTERANSHVRHLLTDFPCENCHNNTIVNGSCKDCHTDRIPPGSMDEVNHINPVYHVNKIKDVVFKDGGTYDPVNKTCSNTACHTGADPQWGDSVNNLVICLTCHGTTEPDVDDFSKFNGTRAKINMSEWADTGHGRPTASGNYKSGNPPANFPGNPCWYCHDNSILHNDNTNPFRLRQHQQFGKRFEKECVYCHMEGKDSECLTCHNAAFSLAPQLSNLTSPPLSQDHTGYTDGQTSCVTACHPTDAERHKTGNGLWTPEEKDDIKNSYMMMGVCLKCHDDDSNNKCSQCHTGTQYQLGFDPGTGFVSATTSKATSAHFGYKHYAAYEGSRDTHIEDGAVSDTAGTTNELKDSSKSWTADQWQGYDVMITSGLNTGENRKILSNTPDTLTLADEFTNPARTGDTYYINDIVWKGGKFCWDCHDPHGDKNIYMIQNKVATETDGKFGIPVSRKTVVFTRKQSGLDYARTSAPYDGICNVCHTETGQHYRFDYGDGHNAGRICTSCHEHRFSDSHASGKPCNTCHLNKPIPRHTAFALPRDCTKCHNGVINGRMDIMGQFRSNSHHVQGVAVTNKHCYACHWEATDLGLINVDNHAGYNYKTHESTSGGDVNLVIWGPGTRPVTYTPGVTAVTFTANLIGTIDERTEVGKITQVCLGCHSDQNNDTQPYNIVDPDNGDCKVPRQYAWDRNSIAARYTQMGYTTWGKYTTTPNTAKKELTKAFSAHGNAAVNEGGFDPVTGLDGAITNTRDGSENIQCFDCHSSHGSKTAGITSSYRTFNGTYNGANLKETQAGKGGYQMTYKAAAIPYPIGTNSYNAGAAQCFDCHLNQTAGAKPWGYGSTFGATKPITGYGDSESVNAGTTAKKERFSYRSSRTLQGGHFSASSPLKGLDGMPGTGDENVGVINGLCTPCHDPHGVSPSLGNDQQYAVPMLKGTWMTSPYKEDVPNSQLGSQSYQPVLNYWTDRRTFGTGRIAEDDTRFAGLCLRCHPKESLTDGTNKNTAWKGLDRIHESIKGWGNNAEHSWPCSKCHQPHNSGLPRLMATNCLNYNHQGKVESGGIYGSYGSYRYPRSNNTSWVCHESPAAGGGSWTDQRWNNVTPW